MARKTNDPFETKSYHHLVSSLKQLLSDSQKKADQQHRTVKDHWNIGKKITQYRAHLSVKGLQEELNLRLAKSLNRERTFIYNVQRIYHAFPKGIPQKYKHPSLTWSHFTEIVSLEPTIRDFYLDLCIEENLPRNQLRNLLRVDYYQMLQMANQKHRYGTLNRPQDSFFVFQASVRKIIDGDTLLLLADQGFFTFHNLSGRLRGINAPELRGPKREAALKSKDFIEKHLAISKVIIIKTYKTDQYGRFVVDIFFHPSWEDPEKVYREGFFLNQMLLDEGLATLALY